MPSAKYEIVVVDSNPIPFPSTRKMVDAGVPVSVAARWQRVRREMSPAGLKRKMQEARN